MTIFFTGAASLPSSLPYPLQLVLKIYLSQETLSDYVFPLSIGSLSIFSCYITCIYVLYT
jgi:hypothetical protein